MTCYTLKMKKVSWHFLKPHFWTNHFLPQPFHYLTVSGPFIEVHQLKNAFISQPLQFSKKFDQLTSMISGKWYLKIHWNLAVPRKEAWSAVLTFANSTVWNMLRFCFSSKQLIVRCIHMASLPLHKHLSSCKTYIYSFTCGLVFPQTWLFQHMWPHIMVTSPSWRCW